MLMPHSVQCSALTEKGTQCDEKAISGFEFCTYHAKSKYEGEVRPRRKLHRIEIAKLIADHDRTAEGLDLSFVDLGNQKLDSEFRKIDLSGAIFGWYPAIFSGVTTNGASFHLTDLRRTKLTYGTFEKTIFYNCDLRNADLRFAKFSDSSFNKAKLQGANLCGAFFYNTSFRGAKLFGADLYLAEFSGDTSITRSMLGGRILQEDKRDYEEFVRNMFLDDSKNPIEHHLANRYEKAVSVYRQLRTNFLRNGHTDDATWAYLRERKMHKKDLRRRARQSFMKKQYWLGVRYSLSWIRELAAEILCNYGESIWPVLLWIGILLFAIGPIPLLLTKALIIPSNVQEIHTSIQSPFVQFLYEYPHYLLFVLESITTNDLSTLTPRYDVVRYFSGFLWIAVIFFIGLLGFVTGNRILKK